MFTDYWRELSKRAHLENFSHNSFLWKSRFVKNRGLDKKNKAFFVLKIFVYQKRNSESYRTDKIKFWSKNDSSDELNIHFSSDFCWHHTKIMKFPTVDKAFFYFSLESGAFFLAGLMMTASVAIISTASVFLVRYILFFNTLNETDQNFFRRILMGKLFRFKKNIFLIFFFQLQSSFILFTFCILPSFLLHR